MIRVSFAASLLQRLRNLELLSLEKSLGRSHYSLYYLNGTCYRQIEIGQRDNSCNLIEERFRLDVKNKFFTQRVVRYWNRLPIEVVDALTDPGSVQGHTGWVLSNLAY